MTVARMAGPMKALSDPNRVCIVKMLLEGEMTVSQMQGKLCVTQPTLSHHLKMLSDAGLLESRSQGSWRYYRLNTDSMRTIGAYFISCADYSDQLRRGERAWPPSPPVVMEQLKKICDREAAV